MIRFNSHPDPVAMIKTSFLLISLDTFVSLFADWLGSSLGSWLSTNSFWEFCRLVSKLHLPGWPHQPIVQKNGAGPVDGRVENYVAFWCFPLSLRQTHVLPVAGLALSWGQWCSHLRLNWLVWLLTSPMNSQFWPIVHPGRSGHKKTKNLRGSTVYHLVCISWVQQCMATTCAWYMTSMLCGFLHLWRLLSTAEEPTRHDHGRIEVDGIAHWTSISEYTPLRIDNHLDT